jgi:hypothetical protein
MPPLAALRGVIERHGGSVELMEEERRWSAILRLPPSQQAVTADGRVSTGALMLAG